MVLLQPRHLSQIKARLMTMVLLQPRHLSQIKVRLMTMVLRQPRHLSQIKARLMTIVLRQHHLSQIKVRLMTMVLRQPRHLSQIKVKLTNTRVTTVIRQRQVTQQLHPSQVTIHTSLHQRITPRLIQPRTLLFQVMLML